MHLRVEREAGEEEVRAAPEPPPGGGDAAAAEGLHRHRGRDELPHRLMVKHVHGTKASTQKP